ncbi:hypothetical protein McpSp1_16530 [Methanocorpusculaceae archaeon Sp1]|nr:hypothetical protein [Methanocorpusculaceae archaeon Sp1]
MNYTAEVKDLPCCTIYYKQGMIRSFEEIPEFILRSAEECRKVNPDLCCNEYCYTAYLEPCDVLPEKEIMIEYGQAVEATGKETETIRFRELEAVPAVCVLHKGDYSSLGDAYAFAFAWADEHGYELAAPPREQYIHGVWDRENSDEWETEVQIPVKRC